MIHINKDYKEKILNSFMLANVPMCRACGNDKFVLFRDTYKSVEVDCPHVELVCSKCNAGYWIVFTSDFVEDQRRSSQQIVFSELKGGIDKK